MGWGTGSMASKPINGTRGFNRKIADRFDLARECIRRHCPGQRNPLGAPLYAYPCFREIIASMGQSDWLRD